MAGRPSINFCKLSLQLGYFTSISVNFPCGQEASHQLLSTFHVAERPSIYFCQLSMQTGKFPSTSVNFLCGQENFHQLPTTFLSAGRSSVNFRQLSVWPGELLLIFVNFPFGRPSVNLSAIPCSRETFRELPSTFRAASRLFVNFR